MLSPELQPSHLYPAKQRRLQCVEKSLTRVLMPSLHRPLTRLADAMIRVFGGESGAGLLLIAVTIAALIMANSNLGGWYYDLFHHPLGWSPISKLDSLHLWINDALMALFFFVVGLEIKREVLQGELATAAQRRLPVLAAMSGIALPALVFMLIAGGDAQLQRGWAIPAATDIAFAVGVLALVGPRVPPSLRLFLLTVAIVDDLGAVAIIALVYTSGIALGWLLVAAIILATLIVLNRRGVTHAWIYALGGAVLWLAVLHSGVHATVAGVLAAFCVPLRNDARGDSPLLRMEHALTPISAYLIVPLFGFANAGVVFGGQGSASLVDPLPLGAAMGLFLGKQMGIFGAIFLAARFKFSEPPSGASWRQVWGVALLCGIGFTMSLFIAQLAFPAQPDLVEEAKLGVLLGSLLSAVGGYFVLRTAPAPVAAL